MLGEEMGRQVAIKKVMTEQELAKMWRGGRHGQSGAGNRAGRVAWKVVCVHTQSVVGIGDRRSRWGSVKQT